MLCFEITARLGRFCENFVRTKLRGTEVAIELYILDHAGLIWGRKKEEGRRIFQISHCRTSCINKIVSKIIALILKMLTADIAKYKHHAITSHEPITELSS